MTREAIVAEDIDQRTRWKLERKVSVVDQYDTSAVCVLTDKMISHPTQFDYVFEFWVPQNFSADSVASGIRYNGFSRRYIDDSDREAGLKFVQVL